MLLGHHIVSRQCQVILVSVLDPSHTDKVLMFSANLHESCFCLVCGGLLLLLFGFCVCLCCVFVCFGVFLRQLASKLEA